MGDTEGQSNTFDVRYDVGLISINAGEEWCAVSLPLDASSTISALSMAIIKCSDPERRYSLAKALAQACKAQSRPGAIITA